MDLLNGLRMIASAAFVFYPCECLLGRHVGYVSEQWTERGQLRE